MTTKPTFDHYPVHCANYDCGPYARSHVPGRPNPFCSCYCHDCLYVANLPIEVAGEIVTKYFV
jgi:hypothetical protein